MKIRTLILISFYALSQSGCVQQASLELDLANDDQKAFYQMGYSTGKALLPSLQERAIDPDTFIKAMNDAMNDIAPPIPAEELQEAEKAYNQAYDEKKKKEMEELAARNLIDGENYRLENAQREGVHSTPSGLQYEIIIKGGGESHPSVEDTLTVHYVGTFVDGREFDSSIARGEPIVFKMNRVIAGWKEALQIMSVGDKWRLVIPPELAYGTQGSSGNVPPNATLIYEVELIDIEKSKG